MLPAVAALGDELVAAGVRVRIDAREYRPGFKFHEWELKGVPVRVEIGARDVAAGAVTVARRDTGDKQQLPITGAAVAIVRMLDDVQAALFRTAVDERERRTLRGPDSYDEMGYLSEAAGFVVAPWCGRGECEAQVKEASAATIRCLPLGEAEGPSGPCVCCGRPAVTAAIWAQAY